MGGAAYRGCWAGTAVAPANECLSSNSRVRPDGVTSDRPTEKPRGRLRGRGHCLARPPRGLAERGVRAKQCLRSQAADS